MLVSHRVIEQSNIAFGTSGARGLVEHFTPNVCAAFTCAFVSVMQQEFRFDTIAIAIDNRPSSYSIAQYCVQALSSLGLKAVYYGVIPTPALAYASMQQKIPSIMVTGSHIPFDRNGLKFYRPDGEISKHNENAILTAKVTFHEFENYKVLVPDPLAQQLYIRRYTDVFSPTLLKGKRIGIYQHSSAGRDIYPELFKKLGADVVEIGRSDVFVPIDTEAVSEQDCIRALDWVKQYDLDSLFSTDGDGDRPMLADENGHWLRGDILGLLCSKYLNIQSLAIPISCNSVIEKTKLFSSVIRTKIGSPYVIESFPELFLKYSSVAGFEANGGYLLGSDIAVGDKILKSLPTRDAVLPVLAVLALSIDSGISSQVSSLPSRFTHSDRLSDFSKNKSKAIIDDIINSPKLFLNQLGFTGIKCFEINELDGLRIILSTEDIIHLRPSGNAPELRCYSESFSIENAKFLVNNTLNKVLALGQSYEA